MIRAVFIIVVLVFVVAGVALSMSYIRYRQAFLAAPQREALFKKGTFDVYLINLRRNKERLLHFTKQYEASDMAFQPFIRFDAVDGKQLDLNQLVTSKAYQEIKDAETSGYRTKHYQLSRGAVGCYISHMNVYRMIAESSADLGIIFEDDVVIPPSIFAHLKLEASKMPNNWDMLLMGCYCIVCKKHQRYSETSRFFFLHAYVVKKECAKKILAYLDNRLIDKQIDTVLSTMAEKKLLTIYCLNTSLARQNNGFKTEIQIPMKKDNTVNPWQLS